MKLSEFLKQEGFTQKSFIEHVEIAKGIRIQGTLAKWILDKRIPRKEEMLVIFSITNGLVQPNDFYGLKNAN